MFGSSGGACAVILLHEGHVLTAAEIAELLNESVGTIKMRIHRARRKLQEIMEIGCAVSQGRNGIPCCEPRLPAVAPGHDLADSAKEVAGKGNRRPK